MDKFIRIFSVLNDDCMFSQLEDVGGSREKFSSYDEDKSAYSKVQF